MCISLPLQNRFFFSSGKIQRLVLFLFYSNILTNWMSFSSPSQLRPPPITCRQFCIHVFNKIVPLENTTIQNSSDYDQSSNILSLICKDFGHSHSVEMRTQTGVLTIYYYFCYSTWHILDWICFGIYTLYTFFIQWKYSFYFNDMEWNGLALKYIINTKRDRITCNLFPNLMTTALNECAIEHDDESFLRMNCK